MQQMVLCLPQAHTLHSQGSQNTGGCGNASARWTCQDRILRQPSRSRPREQLCILFPGVGAKANWWGISPRSCYIVRTRGFASAMRTPNQLTLTSSKGRSLRELNSLPHPWPLGRNGDCRLNSVTSGQNFYLLCLHNKTLGKRWMMRFEELPGQGLYLCPGMVVSFISMGMTYVAT
jgi:hypothetical protein